MKKKLKDRHLDVPSEANRDKHINFVALENAESDAADAPATGALTDNENEEDQKQEQKRNKGDKVYHRSRR